MSSSGVEPALSKPEDEEQKGKEEEEEELEEQNEIEKIDNEEEKEDEGEEEEEEVKVKKKRCQRRKKISQVCYDDDEDEDEADVFFPDEEEEEEDEEDEEGEEDESELSYRSSILSAISFEWENKIYEFDELCDPGNIETIYKRYYTEPDLVDDTGALRYLYACDILRITPTVRFLRALETNEIDLSFRNIDSKNIKAMCYALETNIFVERLILRFNRLSPEDCLCIGRMLHNNEKISYIDFTGCRLNPQGAQTLSEYLSKNETLTYLNFSKCNLEDEGMAALSVCLMRNNSIQHLDLSYNNLGDAAAESLGIALKFNTSITNLNLCYNNLFDVQALKGFFRSLGANHSINNLNLAWNGMNGKEIGGYIGNFLKQSSSVTYLDLSDNRFEGLAISEIKKGLSRSKSLVTLKIGNNPMSPENMDSLLSGAKNCSSLQVLDLENLWVKKSFMKILKKIQQEREIEVNIGGLLGNYAVYGPDYPKLILQRAQFEAMKPKKVKKRKDFGHLIWTLGDEPMTEEEFMTRVKKFKAKVNKELYPELIKEFFNPKIKMIDVVALKEKYLSIFPESEPPPPPKEKVSKKEQKGAKGQTDKKEEEVKRTKKAEETTVVEVGEEYSSAVEIDTEMEEEEEGEFIDNIEHEEHEEEEFEIFENPPEGEDEEESPVEDETEAPNPEND